MTKTNYAPDGYLGATPYLCCNDAPAAIEFYKKAFGAVELFRLTENGGRLGHAEIKIGDAVIMLSDEYPEAGVRSPKSLGGASVSIHVYVENVDKLADTAVAAGAKLLRPVADAFYGDRNCAMEDPFGHRWMFATHKEDVSIDEMQKRYDALTK
ncbi:MAG TPA: VOC family protein [Blastocatellia bacterium]|nr:VOC family protein [Blastocatellia bacterium]